ncbi:MAG: LysR family transcriptional regulator [Huintestinicola sp.]|uniref:LysR family transcriptional regulator n=1 Tax=Huintestinicola sp. TaxID=2981661 RepID=UPI003F092998
MELRVLNYFLMAAREENITKAAQLLHVTQPTLSRQLMQLEDELGVKLFRRSNHRIVLTDEGMLLKRRAQEMIDLAEKTRLDFMRSEQLSGEIAIGSGELISFSSLTEIMSGFQQKNPLVKYRIFSANADSIKDRLEKGLLDLGLLCEPVDIGKYEFIRMAVKEEWGVLVRCDDELAGREYVTPQDLINRRLFVSERALVRNEFLAWFGKNADSLDIAATYNLLYNVAVMVQHKMGIALCIRLEAKYDGLCFVPMKPQLNIGSVMVWKKNQIVSPLINAFIDFAEEYLLSISKDTI